MNDKPESQWPAVSLDSQIEIICVRFEDIWKAGQRPSIEDHLSEMTGNGRNTLLRELLKLELYYRRRMGEEPTLEEYRARFPTDHLTLDEVMAESSVSPSITIDDNSMTKRNGTMAGVPRYVPLKFHAKGGLGEVHVAEDVELRRKVALKRIQQRWAGNDESRRRFLNEAEITGQLEHPGIVPVYGLVQDQDGEPSYAMRFIEGESLQEAIRGFHANDPFGVGARGGNLELRQLLNRFVTVCNTIGYAHSRGIIHRDLKPANVMLGRFGETLVVDWGLAKECNRALDEVGSTTPIAPMTDALADTNDDVAAGTRTGAALGTPTYMSPEQARGERDAIGPASDIFGLGAILYAILTNRAPFEGGSLTDAVDRARGGEFSAPQHVNRGIPAALATVCQKAMAREPKDRYPSALALATDVEHWLADEPVGAYRETFTARSARWVRKHARLATGIAATLVVGLVALGVILWQSEQARVDISAKEAETARERDVAREQKKRTRAALDIMISNEMIARLGTQTELTTGQREFCQKALAYYRDFAAEAATDEEGRKLLADAHHRVASLLTKLGAKSDAEAAYRLAHSAFHQLAAEHPNQPEYRRLRAGSLDDLGVILLELRQSSEAEAAHREAILELQALADEYPDVAIYQRQLARSHAHLGRLLMVLNRLPDGTSVIRKSNSILAKLVEKAPEDRDLRREMTIYQGNLGMVFLHTGDFAEAEVQFRSALSQMSVETDLIRDDPEFRNRLARTQNNLGFALEMTGKQAQAKNAYQEAIANRQTLVVQYPALSGYAAELGGSLTALGNLLLSEGDIEAAVKCHDQAIARIAPIVARQSGVLGTRQGMCDAYRGRAEGYTRLNRYDDALADWDRAGEFADGPKQDLVQIGRAYTFTHLGRTAEAIAIADKCAKNGFPGVLFDAARVYAAVSAGQSSGEAAEKAVTTLRRAFMAGVPIIPTTYANADLAPLRGRDDFNDLLWELAEWPAAAK